MKKPSPPARGLQLSAETMEKRFPGLDNLLGDLREWLPTRVGFPFNDHKTIHAGIIKGIFEGIKQGGGSSFVAHDFHDFHGRMELNRTKGNALEANKTEKEN